MKKNNKNPKRRPRRLRRRGSDVLMFPLSLALVVGMVSYITLLPNKVSSNSVTEKIVTVNDFDTVLVPTPLRNIARGEKLSDVPFTKSKWPRNRIIGEYLKEVEVDTDAIALMPLAANLPISLTSISDKALDVNAVVDGIPDGMRAITVKVDLEAAIEGWARSGNYVDVIVLRLAVDKSMGMEAKVIADKVKIL